MFPIFLNNNKNKQLNDEKTEYLEVRRKIIKNLYDALKLDI